MNQFIPIELIIVIVTAVVVISIVIEIVIAIATEKKNNGIYWISCIEDEREGERDHFFYDFPTIDIDTMKEIVGQYKHSKPTTGINVLQNKLHEQTEQLPKLHRKYHWYNTTQLKDLNQED